ncbi:hypothetical protein [Xanthobacter versatilis]|uniref:hypothetical protein n=1 Tax=Xanthobacter autotrophicus (strain ATCC BAA-1158 / Py2) TaxID=78245 RepID=UPI00372B5D17
MATLQPRLGCESQIFDPCQSGRRGLLADFQRLQCSSSDDRNLVVPGALHDLKRWCPAKYCLVLHVGLVWRPWFDIEHAGAMARCVALMSLVVMIFM